VIRLVCLAPLWSAGARLAEGREVRDEGQEKKETTMKRWLTFTGVLALGAILASPALAQGNPRGMADVTVGSAKVSVEYGRPSLHGRSVQEMLSQLSAGEVWRLGADKSTTFSTTGALAFGNLTLPKGEYSLWARKESDGSWKLVFNKQHGQWGTNHDASKDLVAVPLQQTKASSPAEEVTINLQSQGGGGDVTIQWGDLELTTNFSAK
jgi:hypothetical protein